MGWLIGNNKRAFAEKLMKDIRAREKRENIGVIGDLSPEIQEKRASHNLQEKNSKKMQEVREEREKEDDKQEGQLLAIHGAKVKFNAHKGEFKVLNDVPTTQGKLTGTIVEKQIPNFTFYDGFQMLSLTEWQDFGTVNVQDNFALLKKSTLPGTGKMQGNVPPENGKIEFVDSGQVNVPESITTTGAPVPAIVDVEIIVEFEPLSSYDGEFGFDWIKWDKSDAVLSIQTDDISKLEYVFDNSKLEYVATNTLPELKNKIKSEYKKETFNKIKIPYYASWLSVKEIGQTIKLNMNCTMVSSGDISLQEISFEKNEFYKVTIDGQSNENIKYIPDGKPKEITITCLKPSKEINIVAVDKTKNKIGKIVAIDNTKVFDLPVRLVCVVKDTPNKETEIAQLISDFKSEKIEEYLNKNSLNQALIKTTIETESKYRIAFDETAWSGTFYDTANKWFTNRKDPSGGKVSYTDDDGEKQKDAEYEHILDKFLRDYKKDFEKDGKKFKGILLFISNISKDPADLEGGVSRTQPVNFREAIVFAKNLKDKSTYAHEIAHALGLEHTFWSDINDATELTKNEEHLNKLKNGIKSKEDAIIKNKNNIKIEQNNIKIANNNIKIHQDRTKEYEAYKKTHPNYYKENPDISKYVKEQNAGIENEKKDIEKSKDKIKDNQDSNIINERKLNNEKNNLEVYKQNKYKFKKKETLNFMDYSSKTNCYNQWQWKIMQSDLKNYYGNISEIK